MDRLNFTGDPLVVVMVFFDLFGINSDQLNGRIVFTTVEPFGNSFFEKLRNNAGEDYTTPALYELTNKYVQNYVS
jgi:hypothetical protein